MENKQKAIEKAYIKLLGEKLYSENKSIINFNDGTLKLKCGLKLPNKGLGFSFIGSFSDHSIVIPIELQDIETNNGWIKIESEDDLPKDDSVNYDMYNKNGRAISDLPLKTIIQLFEKGIITHYAIHVQRKPPIY